MLASRAPAFQKAGPLSFEASGERPPDINGHWSPRSTRTDDRRNEMPNQNFNQGSVRATGGRTTRKEGEEASRSSGTGRDYARQGAIQSASTMTSQVQGLLDQQVV